MAAAVNVKASVTVEGGPTFALGSALEPETYTVATVAIDKGTSAEVALLPAGGAVVLLGLRARWSAGAQAGKPATVKVTPRNADEAGTAFDVPGALMIANAGVLAALVEDGPRALTIANEGSDAVAVDVLACLDQ